MTNGSIPQAYEQFVSALREVSILESAVSVLSWDERVNLPPGSSEGRADQLAYLARLHHEKLTSPKMNELLAELESSAVMKGDEFFDIAVNVRWTRRTFERAGWLGTGGQVIECGCESTNSHRQAGCGSAIRSPWQTPRP
jgi:Zn-dependent M32 family carboxypeptidase